MEPPDCDPEGGGLGSRELGSEPPVDYFPLLILWSTRNRKVVGLGLRRRLVSSPFTMGGQGPGTRHQLTRDTEGRLRGSALRQWGGCLWPLLVVVMGQQAHSRHATGPPHVP